jgi:hypothetical protein
VCGVCVAEGDRSSQRHTASEPANRNHRRQTGNQGRERRVQQRYSSVAHQNSAVLPPVRKPRATKPRQGRKRTRKRKKNKQQTKYGNKKQTIIKSWLAFGWHGIPERVGILGDKNVRGGEGRDTRKGRHIAWERSKEKERLAHKTRARAFAVRGPSGWACSYQSTLA